MPTIEELKLEKRRYGLSEIISNEELKKLQEGMPIQYIMGYIEFLNTKIKLDHKVLIPRYETEEMVDLALKKYVKNKIDFKVLDLCCGSGFIGLAIKVNAPKVQVTLSDIDPIAIKQTKENAIENLGSDTRVNIIQSDLFSNVTEKFDLIISNPPYLDENIILNNDKDLKWEPQHALYTKDEGWYFYKKILDHYKSYLNDDGVLIFEINPLHIQKWNELNNVKILNDINNKPRFAIIV
ncbi:peptide chain release factor N(5)-glutamine methyltransferase [Mycoplasma sp. ES3157-GEN-MYC]|uniref:peptide chain release factor N(5)-glutamine methyltransferase n=1 Tax=Mycoplasma miroungigenitalium TaxID=754515 RepID=A0A6M4J8Y2_9MOLU|nr:peptide chain release factor N(5)-glutamine methyltransferase [Mycoplasma miroungigenitalium]MBU4690381.1 peptide chain release factor N(5)-glutamine methyltransferase [Mycoplasma miroungigenitalium]MBU4691648.1 peptide chain release factor N(5)-glutamine methyltransferase [Mycoplasma miroungigenitalium]QJR43473.1 peptide chain release factor N(5)-glutamine methyltransferase [Mycoplasma miroungigenitalium]